MTDSTEADIVEQAKQLTRDLSFDELAIAYINLRAERDAAERDMRERCAGILIAEHDRILSKQEPAKDPMSFADTVNANLRMMAVILPKLADDIHALPTTVIATERKAET